jgi:hypothetical protein
MRSLKAGTTRLGEPEAAEAWLRPGERHDWMSWPVLKV